TVCAVGGVANGLGPFAGRPGDVSLLALQLFLFAIGAPLFIVAVLVSERRQVAMMAAQGERRYRAVISSFPHGGVLVFGADQRHVFADGQGLPEMDLIKDEMEGKTRVEAFSADMAGTLQPHYESALAGNATSFDMLRNGRTFYTQVLPVRDAGSAAGMVVVQDVSEERQAKVLAELDRVKTDFFDDVSHELRTPLTLLLGPLEDLLGVPDRLDPDVRQQLVAARRNAQRLLRLVNTLLDLSRLDAGRLKGTFRPTDLATYSAELAAVFRSAIEHAG